MASQHRMHRPESSLSWKLKMSQFISCLLVH